MTRWFYFFSKVILWVFFRVGFGLHVQGQEHVPARGPFILASNHVSFLDPPLLGAACPRQLTFMARTSLFHGLLGAYLRGVGVMPLKRAEADLSAVRAALGVLQRGGAIAIFPEGGRQILGQIGTVKRGVGLLAEAARVPIVPVVVRGTFQALPPGEERLHRAKIRVAFGPSIAYTTKPATRTSMLESLDLRNPGHAGNQPAAAEASARERHEMLTTSVALAWRRLAEQLNG